LLLKKLRRVLVSRPVIIALVMYLIAFTVLAVDQRSMLYYPSHFYISLQEAHAHNALKELHVRTRDRINLTAWYAQATSKPYTFVFFHGNGDNLASASEVATPFIDAGYGFLVAEYRGYSGLPGSPTESGLYSDGQAYLDSLLVQGVKKESIIIMGHSLGTGVATEMEEEYDAGGLILLAPYLSITKIAQIKFPIFPVSLIVKDRFNNAAKISKIHRPLLIINGASDQLIPPQQGRKLFEMANEPREFDSLPERGHNDLFESATPICVQWVSKLGSIQK